VRFWEKGGGLQAFAAALKAHPDKAHWPGMLVEPALLGLTRAAVTGADGRFRLTGISGEGLVLVRFEGPTIETTGVYATTQARPAIQVPRKKGSFYRSGGLVVHGAVFDHAAAPTRPIQGIVRDRDTGKPLAGVTVRARLGSPKESHFVGDPYIE